LQKTDYPDALHLLGSTAFRDSKNADAVTLILKAIAALKNPSRLEGVLSALPFFLE